MQVINFYVNLVSEKGLCFLYYCFFFLDCGSSCKARWSEEFGNSLKCENIPEEISLEEVIKCTPLFTNRM